MLDRAAEGVDVVSRECPAGAHDQHVDDVEADLDFAVGRVDREPGSRCDLKVAALDLAALTVLGCGDVDEAYFKARAIALLDAIEFAMGKSISDRGTEETVKRFGCSLEKDAS